jgi:hypothetical protein
MKLLVSAVLAVTFLTLVMLLQAASLAAQSNEQFDKLFPLSGNWDTEIDNPDGQDRGNCGGRLGDYGEKLLNCSLPVDQLPLNKRGEAWLKFADHRASPALAECAQVAIPTLLGSGGYISGYPNRVIIHHVDPSGPVTRTIWMNGSGPYPIPGELFQHGYSTGHWDGDDLIVETTNFTFDPDGIDDHLHMASSVRKKVTERYHLIEENLMRLVITLEDPVFLKRPLTYALIESKKPGGPAPAWRECDADVARREVEFGYPGNKYPEDDQ